MLKVLCLHGFNQNQEIFKHKCAFLRDRFKNIFELTFIDAPYKLPNDSGNAWWIYSKEAPLDIKWENIIGHNVDHINLDASLQFVKKIWNENKFDGILGFSQGATMASFICHNKDNLNINPKFVISISGFKSNLLINEIDIPSIHIIGLSDEIILPTYSHDLAKSFKNPLIFEHNGKHVIPSNALFKNKLKEFLNKF